MANKRVARPLIGVTGPARGGRAAWQFSRRLLQLFGARACRLTANNPVPTAPLAGLLVGGGSDIDPDLYAGLYAKNGPLSAKIDLERDALELTLLRQALDQNLPILGICRGAQMLNVALGGTLHQDISSMIRRKRPLRTVLPRKTIVIERDTHLAALMQVQQCRVNSLHHQAIDQLGEGIRVAARDKDQLVQAIEVAAHPCQIGVQWHPEYLPQIPRHRRIFYTLVNVAKQYQQQ